eukprot:4458969-Pyramimonas_sp.AAC.2
MGCEDVCLGRKSLSTYAVGARPRETSHENLNPETPGRPLIPGVGKSRLSSHSSRTPKRPRAFWRRA